MIHMINLMYETNHIEAQSYFEDLKYEDLINQKEIFDAFSEQIREIIKERRLKFLLENHER